MHPADTIALVIAIMILIKQNQEYERQITSIWQVIGKQSELNEMQAEAMSAILEALNVKS